MGRIAVDKLGSQHPIGRDVHTCACEEPVRSCCRDKCNTQQPSDRLQSLRIGKSCMPYR